MKLQMPESSCLLGKKHFEKTGNSKHILVWKLKWLSNETIKSRATFINSHFSVLNYINAEIAVEIIGSCLKQDELILNHLVHKVNFWAFTQSFGFTPKILFGV